MGQKHLDETIVSLYLSNPRGSEVDQGIYGKFGMGRIFKMDSCPYAVPANFPIKPADISISVLAEKNETIGRFGWFEMERIAYRLCVFAQRRGTWKEFMLSELKEFWIPFNGQAINIFDGLGYLLHEKSEGPYVFTVGFVMECWMDNGFPFPKRPYLFAAGGGEYVLKESIVSSDN